MKRDLILEVDPSLYASIEGSTDSEVLFYLALTYGLADDPRVRSSGRSGWSRTSAGATGSSTRSR